MPLGITFPVGRATNITIWVVAGFAAMAGGEFWLFDQIGAHHHTWVYPRWNDQIQYLTEAYTAWENVGPRGFVSTLWATLTNPSAQGTLHDFWAMFVFKVFGPSRSAVLALNMLAFLAWQLAAMARALKCSGSASLAFAAGALLLLLNSPWAAGPGSAVDFRLDWMAAATMGLAYLACLETRRFEDRLGSVLFGAAVAIVLLTRFLTGTYFLLIYLSLALWICSGHGWLRRASNLLLSVAVAALIAGPFYWINRTEIVQYYFIGHFTGPESALRSPHMGLLRSAQWLANHWLHLHVGSQFLACLVLVAAGGLIGVVFLPRKPTEHAWSPVPSFGSLVPALIFFICPALVLIIHVQKSEYVLGILLAGTFGLAWELVDRLLRNTSKAFRNNTAVMLVVVSIGIFASRMQRNPHSPEFESAARNVNTIADQIANRSSQAGLVAPRVAVDRVTDCLDAQVLRVLCYERQHRWIPFIMTLPSGIFRESPDLYWERLRASDFVFVTASGDAGSWPYDHQLSEMRPEVQAWARREMNPVGVVNLTGLTMDLFERRALPQ